MTPASLLEMIGRLGLHGSSRSSKGVEASLEALPERLAGLLSIPAANSIPASSTQYSEVSGLTEMGIGPSDVMSFTEAGREDLPGFFRSAFSKSDYSQRLEHLVAITDTIGAGFDDVTDADRHSWLMSTSILFPLSIYFAYAFLAGEVPSDSSPAGEKGAVGYKLLPILLYTAADEELRKVRTEKEEQDKQRVARLQEGLRTIAPSLRDLAFSKTRKDLNLTGIKNLYSRTYGEVFSTAVVTVPSNKAATLTYGVDKRAQLLFVIEYCARNLGNAIRLLEEYDQLAGIGQASSKPIIPNPSIFLAILRREMTRLKNIEKAIVEAENKLHNQAFVYYSEGARSLSRLPLKSRPEMNRFLKRFRHEINESHSRFHVDQIPPSLRDELVQFLAISK